MIFPGNIGGSNRFRSDETLPDRRELDAQAWAGSRLDFTCIGPAINLAGDSPGCASHRPDAQNGNCERMNITNRQYIAGMHQVDHFPAHNGLHHLPGPGEDNVEQLPQWNRFTELEKVVRFVVLDRTGKQPAHSYQLIHRRIDISATEIRCRVAQNESIRYLVPESVEEIIQREKLYREHSK